MRIAKRCQEMANFAKLQLAQCMQGRTQQQIQEKAQKEVKTFVVYQTSKTNLT